MSAYNVQIRTMAPTDYDAVYALWMSCAGMGLNNLDDSREGIDRFLKRNPQTCFVAEHENRIIGVIMTGSDGRRGFIYHTAVDSAYRKQGIGSRLVDTALTALKKQGIHKAALVVFEKNAAGNAFWEKAGFTSREDLVYRNKALTEMVRFDT